MKNENIICVSVHNMNDIFEMQRQYWTVKASEINKIEFEYHPRNVAEYDFSYKQLIPYAVVRNSNDEILVYQRCGSEKRLSEYLSVGIGGHVNDMDMGDTLYECLTNGLKREFEEEIGISLSDKQITLIGMINEEQTEVGHCHTGVVFDIQIDTFDLKYDAEVGNPQWLPLHNLNFDKFELWSILALNLIHNLR